MFFLGSFKLIVIVIQSCFPAKIHLHLMSSNEIGIVIFMSLLLFQRGQTIDVAAAILNDANETMDEKDCLHALHVVFHELQLMRTVRRYAIQR